MTTRLRTRVENALRIVAAGLIVASTVLALWAKHPQEATPEEFAAGVSDGTITSVGYSVDELGNVYVRWQPSATTWREAEFTAPEQAVAEVAVWDPVEVLRASLRFWAPNGPEPVALAQYPSTHDWSLFDLFAVHNAFHLPTPWLRWTVVAFGVVLVCVMVGIAPRRFGSGRWVVLSLATGFGFLAYLWLESPGRRAAADPEAEPRRLLRDPAALACMAAAGALVVLGI